MLAEDFRIVCPDLPGFGASYKPFDHPESRFSSKRSKALALIDLMERLGHHTFFVAGHDRGSLVAFRMAMDHPDLVRKLITVDGLPAQGQLAPHTASGSALGATGIVAEQSSGWQT